MRQKGKKTGHQPLALIDGGRGSRPAPPGLLNDFEASVWQRVVGSRPAEWFGNDTEQLLLAYCRHADSAAKIDERLAKLKKTKLSTAASIAMLDKLTKMRDRETRAIMSLATKMRLTQQSINPDRAQTMKRKHNEKASAGQPWDG